MAAQALTMFRKLGGSALGRWLFSRIICWKAPYFGSIAPRIEVLEPGRCVVRLRQRRSVQNHIGTVHAIALCNAAELAGGQGTPLAQPPNKRGVDKSQRGGVF